MLRYWKGLVAFFVFAAAVGLTQGQIAIPKRIELGEPFIPRPEVARLSAFGFNTAMADFYWLRAVQVVGSVAHPELHGTILGRFIDVVTKVDPWVDHPYRFAAVWLTRSEADVRQANLLLRRSLPYHPDEWRNRFYLGFNLFYYLEEPDEAAEYFEQAARLPGSPAIPDRSGRAAARREGGPRRRRGADPRALPGGRGSLPARRVREDARGDPHRASRARCSTRRGSATGPGSMPTSRGSRISCGATLRSSRSSRPSPTNGSG